MINNRLRRPFSRNERYTFNQYIYTNVYFDMAEKLQIGEGVDVVSVHRKNKKDSVDSNNTNQIKLPFPFVDEPHDISTCESIVNLGWSDQLRYGMDSVSKVNCRLIPLDTDQFFKWSTEISNDLFSNSANGFLYRFNNSISCDCLVTQGSDLLTDAKLTVALPGYTNIMKKEETGKTNNKEGNIEFPFLLLIANDQGNIYAVVHVYAMPPASHVVQYDARDGKSNLPDIDHRYKIDVYYNSTIISVSGLNMYIYYHIPDEIEKRFDINTNMVLPPTYLIGKEFVTFHYMKGNVRAERNLLDKEGKQQSVDIDLPLVVPQKVEQMSINFDDDCISGAITSFNEQKIYSIKKLTDRIKSLDSCDIIVARGKSKLMVDISYNLIFYPMNDNAIGCVADVYFLRKSHEIARLLSDLVLKELQAILSNLQQMNKSKKSGYYGHKPSEYKTENEWLEHITGGQKS